MNSLEKAFQYQAVYMGMKLHFNGKYDYSKYGPLRRNQNPDTFETNPDRFVLIGFAKKFSVQEDFEEYLRLYGFRTGKVPYIRDFSDREVEEEFKNVYGKLKHSFEYQMESLLRDLSISDLKTNGVDQPRILDLLNERKIYPSQFVVLDRTYNLSEKYAKIFENDLLFQTRNDIYLRYKSAMAIKDLERLKTLVKQTLN